MSWHERPADAVQFDHNNWTDLAGKAQSPCASRTEAEKSAGLQGEFNLALSNHDAPNGWT